MLFSSVAFAAPLAARAWIEDQKLYVRNDGSVPLTQVVGVIDQTVMCDVGSVPTRGEVAMPIEWCVGALPATPLQVELTSKQGSMLVPLKAPDRVHKVRFRAELKGGRLVVHNEDGIALTSCTVSVNGSWSFFLGSLPAEGGEGVYLTRLQDAQGNALTSRTEPRSTHLECQEGAGSYVFEGE